MGDGRWRLYEPLVLAAKAKGPPYPDGAPPECVRLARCSDGHIAFLGWGNGDQVQWVLDPDDAHSLHVQLGEAIDLPKGGASERDCSGGESG